MQRQGSFVTGEKAGRARQAINMLKTGKSCQPCGHHVLIVCTWSSGYLTSHVPYWLQVTAVKWFNLTSSPVSTPTRSATMACDCRSLYFLSRHYGKTCQKSLPPMYYGPSTIASFRQPIVDRLTAPVFTSRVSKLGDIDLVPLESSSAPSSARSSSPATRIILHSGRKARWNNIKPSHMHPHHIAHSSHTLILDIAPPHILHYRIRTLTRRSFTASKLFSLRSQDAAIAYRISSPFT